MIKLVLVKKAVTFHSDIYFQIFNAKMNFSNDFRVLVRVLGHQLVFKQLLYLYSKRDINVSQKTLPSADDFGVYSIVPEILCIDSLKNGFRIRFLKELRWPTLTTHKSKYFRSVAVCPFQKLQLSWLLLLSYIVSIHIHISNQDEKSYVIFNS